MFSLNALIEAEYAKLVFFTDTPSSDHDFERLYPTALSEQNIEKNRYSNILPSEKTRVKLNGERDYINANVVKFKMDDFFDEYICCQAPLESTVGDFWRMVWEKDVPIICSLNRIMENGRIKGDIYWPELSDSGEWDELYVEPFKVTMFNYFEMSDIDTIFRMLELHNLELNSTRKVLHIQYLGWCDFGVPTTTFHIRSIAKIIAQWKNSSPLNNRTGPTVVHCSAGVGRTGTFVAISQVLKSHNFKNQKFDDFEIFTNLYKSWKVLDVVFSLRKQRNFAMVQTREQYGFIYKALVDELSMPPSVIPNCPFTENGSSIFSNIEMNSDEMYQEERSSIMDNGNSKRRRKELFGELKQILPTTKKRKISEDNQETEEPQDC
jgi:protein tyrosine phosphatase